MPAATTLVIRPGALGDAILTLPALSKLKREFAEPLAVLGTPASWAFLRPSADVRVLDFGAPAWLGLFADGIELPAEAAALLRDVERAFVLLKGEQSDLERRLKSFGVKQVFVEEPPTGWRENQGARVSMPTTTQWPKTRLPLQHASQMLGASGAEDVDEWIAAADHERTHAEEFLNGLRGKYRVEHFVAIHPGSGGRRKCWPAHFFARLAAGIYFNFNQLPLVLFGPADEHTRAEFMGAMPRLAAWQGLDSPPLRDLLAMLRCCTLAVTNDSGIAHLAARATRTLAIFGPTDPEIWSPVGDDVTTIQASRGDLKKLSVGAVFAAVMGR